MQDMNVWKPNFDVMQTPGTDVQRDCNLWFRYRWARVTASICITVVQLGENVDRYQC